MKFVTLLFLGLLAWSQCVAGPELVERPLSMFREGEFRAVGYALFGLLLTVGLLMMASMWRSQRAAEATLFGTALALLAVIASTPSLHAVHEVAAALLLLLLFAYYAGKLILERSNFLYFHLVVPLALVPLLGLGYGPWQKALIVYLVVIVNIHWHLMGAVGTERRQRRRVKSFAKKRIVYRLEPGTAWTRRQRPGSTSVA